MTALTRPMETAAVVPDGDFLLRVENLSTEFGDPEHGAVQAVREVSFTVRPGETLGLVGESGSGKSVTMMSVLGLIRYTGGRVVAGEAWFDGRDLLQLPQRELRKIRGRQIGLIFQDPMTSLNPVLTVGYQIGEALRKHLDLSRSAARQRAVELLDMVRIPDPARRLGNFPHEMSGGMRQRVMIAMALSCDPALLIADEPTTALDVTVQAQILDLIGGLAREMDMGIVLISHDLGVIAGLADRVAVMYAGSIVETGPARQVFKHTRHPYTLGLLRSSPRIDAPRTRLLPAIGGTPPDPATPPAGCPFHPRCPFHYDQCLAERPPLRTAPPTGALGHRTACWVDLEDGAVFADRDGEIR
jgi:oligopeptide transport system ATP-binding protein